MASKDNTFTLKFSNFNDGAAPLAHLDSLTQIGQTGHYSAAANVDIISKPGLLTQGPGLATLTAGDESGAVGELINFILDKPVTDGVTYGIAATKLHKITPSAVTNTGAWPHAITGATAGSSAALFQGALYYFYNKASGADCGMYDLASSFTDAYFSAVPIGAAALQNAPHPIATKQDIMLFGNGRYVGTFVSTGLVLSPTKLDFGADTQCADVAFHANQWWIAINSGVITGTNRSSAQIYLYDGGAISAILSDEVAVGRQKIGFIYPVNGIVYVAYQDLSSTGGFAIGYVKGRQLIPLRYFTGTLPTFAQKTLYNSTIAFISNGLIYSCGAVIPQLPVQISHLATGGYTTVGALAAPFGTPMVASTQSTSFKLAQFSGYTTAATWRSIVLPIISARMLGYIDQIIVLTKTLGASARCDLILEGDQASASSATQQITGTGKRRHVFSQLGFLSREDFRIFLNWANGSASNDAAIREIIVEGHYVEK
jgi:hypothetical protein